VNPKNLIRESTDRLQGKFWRATPRPKLEGEESDARSWPVIQAADEWPVIQAADEWREFFAPEVQTQLIKPGSSLMGVSIMQELAEDSAEGRIHPFVEGEPIGRIQEGKLAQKAIEPAGEQATREHNDRMQRRNDEMLALRDRNDRTITALLRRM
jgi:hypothetical protein